MAYYSVIIFSLLYLGIAAQTNELYANGKIDDDRRIWGFVKETDNNIKSTETLGTKNAKDSSCTSKKTNPKRPDFSAPGRRISETKCYEYIWELKHRDDISKNTIQSSLGGNGGGWSRPSVIGEPNTFPSEFPHMGAIGWKGVTETWVFKCGSTLISSKFVLTAAHCSSASEIDTAIADTVPKIVRLGTENLFLFAGRRRDAKIVNILVHPQYSSPKRYFDIALMKLEQSVTFSKHLQPACLWTTPDTNQIKNATVTGWGFIKRGDQNIHPELQAAVIDLIDSETCNRLLLPTYDRNWFGVQDHQMCGGILAGGVDACRGDSGGPLQVEIPIPITSEGGMHYVIGVTSFGALRCASPNVPGVYTRVGSFIDWIETNVWPNCTS